MKNDKLIELAREKLPENAHNKKYNNQYIRVPIKTDEVPILVMQDTPPNTRCTNYMRVVRFRQRTYYPDKPAHDTHPCYWGEPTYFWEFDCIE
tara:strand:- start:442 stop:720 length:279 start_codon:yes stop_codon:yes gene_type:complete